MYIIPLEFIDTHNAWEERRKLILGKNIIHTNLNRIISDSERKKYSLVIFKPKKIVDFISEPANPEWDPVKEKAVKDAIKQEVLFEEYDLYSKDFKLMPKLPWKFKYKFLDDEDKSSTLMIEDWEIGQLYWNCLKNGNEKEAVSKVREKYLDDLARTKDLHLFLGTTLRWHLVAPNPYVIVGTFHPPFMRQPSLF